MMYRFMQAKLFVPDISHVETRPFFPLLYYATKNPFCQFFSRFS